MAKIMKKILTAVLSLAMVACFVPQTGVQVYAADEGPASMAMGSDALSKDAGKNGAQTVWYAGSAWRVIGYNGGGVASTEGDMTLLASDNLQTGVPFNTYDKYDNDYEGSNLKGVIDDLYADRFSPGEKTAVKNRTLEVGEYTDYSPFSTGVSGTATSGYLWPLSTEEALSLRTAESAFLLHASGSWWLRSPGDVGVNAALVNPDGAVISTGNDVGHKYSVRPAFNFDLKSVLFTSAAEGGKSSGAAGADALTEVGTNSGSEWKLTLKSGHDDFEITECAPTANGVVVKYKGAIPGTEDDPEYISAIIKDSDGNIKYYGRIAKASGDDDATVTINTAGKLEDGDTLYVFNEQYNGDKMTDYASALQEVEVPHASMAMGSDALSKDAGKNGAQTVWYAGSAWRVIGYNGGGVASTEGDMTLLASDNLQTRVQFNTNDKYDNDYEGSNLKGVIDGLYADRFSPGEKTAVKNRTLEVGEYTDYEPYSTGVSGTATSGYLWPLSTEEALSLRTTESAFLLQASGFWWLRSPGYIFTTAALVTTDGAVSDLGLSVGNNYGVRPAFNLNLESVLFTSAAEGGKSSGAEGALNEVGTNTTGEWKLTLLDDGTITGLDGHKDFALSHVAGVKNGVSVKYTGAQPGNNEYISAIITDKPITEDGSAIKCYGRIAEASAADGTVTINTAGKLGENDHLYVFNEQYNDDKKTDYASALQEVPIPKLISYTVTFKVKNGSWNDGTKADQKVTLSRYDNEDKALVLQPGDIPKVGNRPASGYKAGSWDVTPKTDTQVSKDMTYTYTYAEADNPSPPKPQPKPIIDKAAAKIALDAGVVARSSGSKVTAGWGAVKGASSYVIYANYCDRKTLKKIKTVSGKTTSFDITKLNGKKFNPKKNLKFYVVAYKTVKGKKVKLAKSIMAHAPGSKNSKCTNVTGVKVKKASFTLKKGKTAKIKAKLILQKKSRKPLKHCAKFRYASSNKKVAKVNKKGKITAVGKGKCTVYVYAVSGVSKKIKVTVK